MIYRDSTTKNIDINQIRSIRKSIGWQPRSEKKWKEILFKSSFVYSVYDEKKLIGMGRLVEDGIMCMFYDIVVHKKYQGKGIGKLIVSKLIEQTKGKKYCSVSLFTEKDKIKFYEKLGFKIDNFGMELKNLNLNI
ncbi:GNAT family N-acetyltransferase [bacterium]|jgi:ribosomal protein S18 acetylase RimI-like enzyme|nr:GNAT family N-acetyltransferase [bacterium]